MSTYKKTVQNRNAIENIIDKLYKKDIIDASERREIYKEFEE